MSDDDDVDFHEDDFEYDYWSGYNIDTSSNDITAGGNGAQNYTNRHPMTGSPLSTPPPLADSMIAHQLSHMSMQDQVYLDSHGVREKEVVETPLLVFESMEHMKVQLQQFVLQGRAQAYHQAIQQNPFYCHKPDTLTKFVTGRIDGSKSSSTSYGPTL
jgi:hypothetical protein